MSTVQSVSSTDSSALDGQCDNSKGKEHQVLQEVLKLLAAPIIEDNDSNEKNQITELKQENTDLRNALSKMASLLRDRAGQCLMLEKKTSALTLQANSLKEVVTITKDLLNIRNAEVKHLQEDMASMEEKIKQGRERHQKMMEKLDFATELNAKLRKEYETQLELFKNLRQNYERRAQLLEKTNPPSGNTDTNSN